MIAGNPERSESYVQPRPCTAVVTTVLLRRPAVTLKAAADTARRAGNEPQSTQRPVHGPGRGLRAVRRHGGPAGSCRTCVASTTTRPSARRSAGPGEGYAPPPTGLRTPSPRRSRPRRVAHEAAERIGWVGDGAGRPRPRRRRSHPQRRPGARPAGVTIAQLMSATERTPRAHFHTGLRAPAQGRRCEGPPPVTFPAPKAPTLRRAAQEVGSGTVEFVDAADPAQARGATNV
ncbi:hypothetical protein SRB17_25830 [Streptomyces sp. RB17]|nr:hypothetical protein [Streptomyces sp. RB17]